MVLLGGDLNMHPEDVGIRLLRGWAGLRDSFTAAERIEVGTWMSSYERDGQEGRLTSLPLPLSVPS